MALLGLPLSYLVFTVLHIFAFALALAVCGLYGHDLQRANEAGVGADGRWVYAVVTGGLSAVTCIAYFVPFVLRVGGIFAMYINENAEGDGGIERMKNAVWVDLANALLWLIITVAAGLYWVRHRDTRSRFTGRAHV
ncbi:hypothetical protein S7711_01856 [Stachybotrys chartarum IBT 7711]|uniref:MARVEL domain-containing protein n=1 Tax=Stachybotrys chartarum (strain CBS 109288 / IBT 7711) TaxID=1280523 RepID=A0A084AJ66_STACB|nr:hypothetical protein S7711_01856 [Stachybotrys chartarum IBT 7711]KFA47493.1 hypothetical protein S40293_02175 [Stachybotrys chartarum IBT 40293]KFA73935.1 hypothetical protein S40288_00906 [Stachybotrys chartarum IBT 40288]